MGTLAKVFFGLVIVIFVFVIAAALFVLPYVAIPVNTGNGQHTGYVTAIEQNGLFFKAWRAYVKTDTQSSQEDQYCVIDPAVITQLKTAVDSKEHVTLSYVSWISAGVKCKGEDAIITGVVTVPN